MVDTILRPNGISL